MATQFRCKPHWSAYAGEFSHLQVPPAMLTYNEGLFYYFIGRDIFEFVGDFVELGPFLGGSTVCFLAGINHNKRKRLFPDFKLKTFDIFEYDGNWGNLDQYRILPGDNYHNKFLYNTKEYSSGIDLHAGDLFDVHSYNRQIEVLFVDVAKTENLLLHTVEVFFPKLIPEKSIIIHQDYLFRGLPYIKAFMEYFSDYFVIEFFPKVVPTVVFRLSKSWDITDARLGEYAALPVEEKMALVEKASSRFPAQFAPVFEDSSRRFRSSEWREKFMR